jgi:photosystem II stability/assembly factor-like uncharacterized protein
MNRVGYLAVTMLAAGSAAGQNITWSTFFGGTSDDYPRAIAVDRDGNVYVAGHTTSTDFLSSAANRITHSDIFVAKLNAAGTRLIYFVRIGGDGVEQAAGLAVGEDGSAYVTGTAWNSGFPTRNAAFPEARGSSDTFVLRLDPSGEVLYSTFLGLNTADGGAGIAVDKAGNAYVLSRSHTTFILGIDTSTAVHVTKLDSSGRLGFRYQFGEIAGEGNNYPGSIAIGPDGDIWVSGYTNWTSFPIVESVRRSVSTQGAGFLAKLKAGGNELLFSTVDVEPYARLVTDPDGAVHVWARSEPRYGPLLLRSEDAGATWEGRDYLDRREPFDNLHISAAGSSRLYATAGVDVIRSQDEGHTWRTLLSGSGFSSMQLALHPTNPDVLFVGDFFFGGGVRKSTDGGATWNPVWDTEWGVSALLADSGEPGTVYASECSYLGNFVARLTEGADRFARVSALGADQCFSRLEAAGGAIFALTNSGDLLRTSDGAYTWEKFRSGLRGIKGQDSILYAWTATSLSKSSDRGQSWVELAQDVFHDLTIDPSSPNVLYASTTGGISKSLDGGMTWRTVVAGGGPASIAVDPKAPSTVYAGFASRVSYPIRPLLRPLDAGGPPRAIPDAATLPAELAALDAAGNLFLAGATQNSALPVLKAVQPEYGGGIDTFLTSIGPDASPTSSTYLGGWDTDRVTAMALDRQGNVLMTGWTGGGNFPIRNAIQPEYRGNIDGFVIKIAPR